MLNIGRKQKLVVVKKVEFGIYLGETREAGEKERVLLPIKQVPEGTKEGDELEVFLYRDSSDRLIATTREPKLVLGELAVLNVAATGKIGAFLDWGLEKDLFLPYKEMTKKVQPGDEVVIPEPCFVCYEPITQLTGGVPVHIATRAEDQFRLTADQLRAAITPKTKLLILCSPSNPTGSVYSREELEALASVLERHPQVFVISDEIYEHINYVGAHQSLAQFPSIRERIVIINGVSKGYAMTGWRIGFIAAPLWIAKACNKLQGQYTSGASSIAQKAAAAAFAGEQGCVETMRQAFQHRRDLVVRLAKEIPGLKVNDPQGAFYLFPEISHYLGKSDGERKINTSSDLAMYILEVGHVATVAGDAFGAPDYLRLSYATSEENITEAMRRMKEVLARLK